MKANETEQATMLVKRFHYSGRVPSNVQACLTWHEPGGLFGDSGPAVAACFVTIPAARWSEPVVELSRLVRRDDVSTPLSSFLSEVVAYLKQRRQLDLIVSFADRAEGHHGGIYQACSWNYHGLRDRRMDGVVVNGRFMHARTAVHTWGTQSPDKLRALGVAATPHYDEGKHCYWRALHRAGNRKASRLGLESNLYPKDDAGRSTPDDAA